MKSSPHISVGLDIGSNTISCTKLFKDDQGEVHVLKDKSFPVRLSEGLRQGGELKATAVKRGLDALEKIVSSFDYKTAKGKAVGTAVLRMTSAPEAFTKPAAEILGTSIEIIDGLEEARLTGIGAVFGLPVRTDWLILDIGGQSTEISCSICEGPWKSVSMPLGVVKVTESFFSSQTPSLTEQQAARKYVQQLLGEHIKKDEMCGTLVCVGGTPTTLSMLVHGLTGWKRKKVHGDVISRTDTQKWYETVVAVDAQTRVDKYGMRPMRADVFPAGILILDEIMDYLQINDFTVSANGLRVGLALSNL